jgi:hypothetical protein
MKSIISIVLLIMMFGSVSAANIDGVWKTKINNTEVTFVFKAEGTNFTGYLQRTDKNIPILNGKITGDSIYFTMSFPEHDVIVTYIGKLNKDNTIELQTKGQPGGDKVLTFSQQK